MRLSQWLRAQALNDVEFAKQVGATKSAVGRWRKGQRTPGAAYLRKIVKLTDGQVTPSDFFLYAAPAARESEGAPR